MDSLMPVCLLLLLTMTSSEATFKVVDMTHELGNDTLYWPGNPSFQFEIIARGNQSGGYWYESNLFSTPEHGGTHVDSPSHFYENSWRVEQIPASHLVGPAIVVNVRTKAAANADYRLSEGDLQDWEREHGRIPAKSIVLMDSDWDSRYPNASLVYNTDTPTDPSTFHFPGIHPDAATFLVTQRDVIAVGVDTPSTDYGQSVAFETHVILGEHNVLGLENLANVHMLPARGATLVIGLVKLVDGSGGPARILGLLGEDCTGGGHRSAVVDVLLCWVMVMVVSLGSWVRGW